jgi:hypothetical protein
MTIVVVCSSSFLLFNLFFFASISESQSLLTFLVKRRVLVLDKERTERGRVSRV